MHYTYTMIQAFETEKNRKAFIYTAIICALIVILFFLIRWTVLPVSVPVIEDLIEINLGNDEEGFGEEQPLIKGNFTPSQETIVASKQETSNSAPDNKVQPDDNAEEDAAAVVKPVKNNTKIKTETPVKPAPVPTPKPQKPKNTYNGPGSGLPGNNPTDDNGYKSQGTNPDGKNDNGSPGGNKDSYGTTPGGKVGGPKVTRGNRKIVRYYSFTGELNKATIYAIIKVSPSGQGRFIGFEKGSTSRNQAYADAISNYLRNIQFDKAEDESTVTVQFNFSIN